MNMKRNSGFTLLEIIIVIIIIGVLASLALPRLFSTVEYSRSAEALSAIATIRSSLERCYLQANGDYTECDESTGNLDRVLDIDDPADSPNAHFDYYVYSTEPDNYKIVAVRNTLDYTGNDNADNIVAVLMDGDDLEKCGVEAYAAIGGDAANCVNSNAGL